MMMTAFPWLPIAVNMIHDVGLLANNRWQATRADGQIKYFGYVCYSIESRVWYVVWWSVPVFI